MEGVVNKVWTFLYACCECITDCLSDRHVVRQLNNGVKAVHKTAVSNRYATGVSKDGVSFEFKAQVPPLKSMNRDLKF